MQDDPDATKSSATEASDIKDQGGSTSEWDNLLAKYVRVWIWSILFGATSGLSYAYLGIRLDRPWGSLTALPLAILVLGIMATLGAWSSLLQHLRISILPTFFGYQRRTPHDDDPRYQDWLHKRSSTSIIKAYQFLLLAAIARLMLVMADLIFELVRSTSL